MSNRSFELATRISFDDKFFGGNRENAIERDDGKCTECGMTRKEHFELYKKDIDVHHIDGGNKRAEHPNHSMDNLKTLCKICHNKKHLDLFITNNFYINKKECKHGHPFSEENTLLIKYKSKRTGEYRSGRACKTCKSIYRKNLRAKVRNA